MRFLLVAMVYCCLREGKCHSEAWEERTKWKLGTQHLLIEGYQDLFIDKLKSPGCNRKYKKYWEQISIGVSRRWLQSILHKGKLKIDSKYIGGSAKIILISWQHARHSVCTPCNKYYTAECTTQSLVSHLALSPTGFLSLSLVLLLYESSQPGTSSKERIPGSYRPRYTVSRSRHPVRAESLTCIPV